MKDVQEIKKDFPMLQHYPLINYLDNAATSLKPQSVLDKMNEYYTQYGVNVHRGAYQLAHVASYEFDTAREKIANFIHADPDEIILTKGASESLNEAHLFLCDQLRPGDEIVCNYLEHHSAILPWLHWSFHHTNPIRYVLLDSQCRLNPQELEKTITPQSKILVVTMVSNVLGFVTNVKECAKIAHQHNMIVIVDATQAVQHVPIDVRDLDCDFLAFSGHKMLGPSGVGVLYGKKSILNRCTPVYWGGGMMEDVDLHHIVLKGAPHKFEVGTPMMAEVIGLGAAIDYIQALGFDWIQQHDAKLVAYLKQQLSLLQGITIYNIDMDLPIVAFNINGVHPHDAASFYDEARILLRAGHHCAQLLTQHLGCENGTLRASFYIYNDFEDVDRFIEVTNQIIQFFGGALDE